MCKEIWKPSTRAHLFSCLHLMSPKRLLPESHPKVNLRLSLLNTIQTLWHSAETLGESERAGSSSIAGFWVFFLGPPLIQNFRTNESRLALMKSQQSIAVCTVMPLTCWRLSGHTARRQVGDHHYLSSRWVLLYWGVFPKLFTCW